MTDLDLCLVNTVIMLSSWHGFVEDSDGVVPKVQQRTPILPHAPVVRWAMHGWGIAWGQANVSVRSEIFGRLLKGAINSIAAYEGKTAPLIEEELGAQIGLAGSAIQRYKAGHVPSDPRTIQVLAEAAIQRGYLSRIWLQRFLQAARYLATDQLVEQLCPSGPERPRPPRVYHNLPAPTYSQFIMRQEPYAEVLDGLSKRSAAVLILGLGGSGKTSLAREIAGGCLNSSAEPRFDAAVWVSDSDRPGTTNLTIVLDEIARTLDYPGFTQYEHADKCREVEQLLRRQRVLVVVDNVETVTDAILLTWLLDMPEPSKALITAREDRRVFRRGGWPVELRGMADPEARALIDERLRFLRIERLVRGREQIEPLIAATGGNPKAIELALGLVKYEHHPLRQVVADLYAARGDLFADLFARAWLLLDEATRRVLSLLTLFPISAGSAALGMVADLQGFALDRTLERLADLALIDMQQADLDSQPRYVLHPLARAFATARLAEHPELEQAGRQRWLAWYLQVAAWMDARWYDTHALAALDAESDNLSAAIDWAMQAGHYREALRISALLGYYYYVRGRWSEQLRVNAIRLNAARQLGDRLEEGYSLLNTLRVLALQGRIVEAGELVAVLQSIMASVAQTPVQRCSFLHGLAVFALASGDAATGSRLLHEVLQLSHGTDRYKQVRARNWLADSLLRAGDLEQAEQLLGESLPEALQIGYNRAATFCEHRLALIAIQTDRHDLAERLLATSLERAISSQDRRDLAIIKQTTALLHAQQGDSATARMLLDEAADIFERLGMRRELHQARIERTQLEMRVAL